MPRSVMEHNFAQVPRSDIPRSSFNRSSGLKTTFDADYLYPIFVDPVVPGDSGRMNCSFFVRLATPLHPIMDNMYIETFWFYTPNRLVWYAAEQSSDGSWEKFMGAQNDPGDSIDFTIPVLGGSTSDDWTDATLIHDYMGLPYDATGDSTEVNGLPFRMYNLIFNTWFKHQDLTDNADVMTSDSSGAGSSLYPLRKRTKRHDYFTSALPWPNKSGTDVNISIGGRADVRGIGVGSGQTGAASVSRKTVTSTTEVLPFANTNPATLSLQMHGTGAGDLLDIYADLGTATGASINDLRLAIATQQILERDARSGTRYPEVIRAHFGVELPDAQWRPSFLGGGSTRINITPVANTSEDATSKQGDLTGFGTAGGTHSWTANFPEHGYVIGIVNARADITYQQGLERHWIYSTRYDFYFPLFANLGEQPIYNREIYYTGSGAPNDLVFGYTESFNELRYKPSRITGKFRSDATGSLEAWHLSEDFSALPTLGNTFIESNTGTPLDRAIAVPSEPQFIGDFYFDYQMARPMPIHGVPGLDRL